MTCPESGSPAPSRMASAWNAPGDRSAISRRRWWSSARNASDVRTRLGATSAADRLAPGNSSSKSLSAPGSSTTVSYPAQPQSLSSKAESPDSTAERANDAEDGGRRRAVTARRRGGKSKGAVLADHRSRRPHRRAPAGHLSDTRRVEHEPIFHLAVSAEWQEAVSAGIYERSTLGRSLEEQGFIHCSYPHQLQAVADIHYSGRSDVVLLQIDPAKVDAKIVDENLEGGSQLFPHIYGALPVAAVVSARPVRLDGTGRLLLTDGT